MTIALETQNLEKQFGGLRVTRELSLKIEQGGAKIILPRSQHGHCDQVQALALCAYEMRFAPGAEDEAVAGKSRLVAELHDALDATPRDVGDLAFRAGLGIGTCAAMVIDLELGGLAARSAGGRYVRLR